MSYPNAPAVIDAQSDIVRRWQGVVKEQESDFYAESAFELEFTRADDGKPTGMWLHRSPFFNRPLNKLSYEEGRFHAERGPISLTGALRDGGNALAVEIKSGEDALSVALRKNDPRLIKYRVPRLDQAGRRQDEYLYRQPVQVNDGWKTSSLKAEGFDESWINELMKAILKEEFHLVDSVLIARHGKLVLEEYFYAHRRDVAHQISSSTKSVSSMIVGTLIDRQVIKSVDEKVFPLFPEYAGKKWIQEKYPITLRHILSMTSGLEWHEDDVPYNDPRNSAAALLRTSDWTGFMLNVDLAQAPGEQYEYNSGPSGMLGKIVKKATGKEIDEVAREYLFSPLGTKSYRWAKQPDGSPRPEGGFEMLPRDMAKLGQLMLNRGIWNGQRVLSEGWIDRSVSRQTKPGD